MTRASRDSGLAAALLAAAGAAQAPAAGQAYLDRNDPVQALQAYRQLLPAADAAIDLGLARAHLELGAPHLALRYVRACAAREADEPDAVALELRARLRARDFLGALAVAEAAQRRGLGAGSAELLAAHASTVFRLQRNTRAAELYAEVLQLDPLHIEAHVRLGSGLIPPREVTRPPALRRGVEALQQGDHAAAAAAFQAVLRQHADHPIAHRLLGDALLAARYRDSMPATSPEFARLRALLPEPGVDADLAARFMPGFRELGAARQAVARRALGLFRSFLPKLVAMGGSHDLLTELERTTDAPARSSLRGKRTFDGRVWDDVRGMGGLRAATGIESLDEAEQFGFDTLAHELAHQAHLYAFQPVQRARIRELYRRAKAADRFLDFYAASNEAEYFGQGVEAFVSLGKRPGREVTHGHTRFELLRVDPELHGFIASVVDFDPLGDRADRDLLLAAAVAVALRCGRWEDAVTAAGMMRPGEARRLWQERARRALLAGFGW